MKKSLLILTIISVLILATGATLAWLSFADDYPLVEIKSGSLLVDQTVSGNTLTNNVELNSLMYVDFYEDVIIDKTSTLNLISTNLVITFTGQTNSLDFKNQIELTFPIDQEDLIYVIINEGLDIGSNPVTTDYHSYLENLVSVGNTSTTDWRNAIALNNQTVLSNIKTTTLTENQTLTIQIIFWGDYDNLTNQENYLLETYNVDIDITSVQIAREWD